MDINYGVLFAAEMVGTMILVLMGNGVGMNILGRKTFGTNGGWLMGSFAWGMAVMLGVFASQAIAGTTLAGTGGSLNPAVSVALMIKDSNSFAANAVTPEIGFIYIAGELVGAFVGQAILNLLNNRVLMEIKEKSFGAHSCSPAYKESLPTNFAVEFVATCVLIVVAVYAFGQIQGIPAGLTPLLVGLLILSIALSLGGLTGYAINPARDAMPRLVYMATHKLMKFEGSAVKAANWQYGWVPVVGPLAAGAVIGGFMAI